MHIDGFFDVVKILPSAPRGQLSLQCEYCGKMGDSNDMVAVKRQPYTYLHVSCLDAIEQEAYETEDE